MRTTDKVQTGDTVKGTSTSTTYDNMIYTYGNSSCSTEKGWECPRCGRINAPWVRQCDCPRNDNKWEITWNKDDCAKPWWYDYKVTCNGTSAQTQIDSDTFKIHPESVVFTTNVNQAVGGSDYKDSVTGDWVNVPKTYTNSVKR